MRKRCSKNDIRFIDGINLAIERPSDDGLQNMVYNLHEIFNALTFHAIFCPNGIRLNGHGLFEGAEARLSSIHTIRLGPWKKYSVYGNSGYNVQLYLTLPFQGAVLNADQRAFIVTMETDRITV